MLESPDQHIFLGADEVDLLEKSIDDTIAGVVTETITNPLNEKVDLPRIGKICQAYNIPLVVDNTLATPVNCQPLKWGASFSIHSAVKYLSGDNSHVGGVLLTNDPTLEKRVKEYLRLYELGMSPLEVQVLSSKIKNFKERMARFEKNAMQVATFLSQNLKVGQLYFPEKVSEFCQGRGAVVSFTLAQNDLESLRQFYDSLNIVKAPTLGSNQTLVCPYTLLTYYHQSDDFLNQMGLPRYLVRVAVGCEEDITSVISALKDALDCVR